jgi:hypothetical protein
MTFGQEGPQRGRSIRSQQRADSAQENRDREGDLLPSCQRRGIGAAQKVDLALLHRGEAILDRHLDPIGGERGESKLGFDPLGDLLA